MSVKRYLKRMGGSIDDKLKVLEYIPENADYVLDVGCASGHVTAEIADRLITPDPNDENPHVHGIDINLPFVGMAQGQYGLPLNVSFSHNWLSDLLAYDTKYDATLFMSVLHEFYSTSGITGVVKVLSDAHDLLKPGGRIIIRDMIRPDNTPHIAQDVTRDRYDIIQNYSNIRGLVNNFETKRGGIYSDVPKMNELLLHLLYPDNWTNEMKETYLFWSGVDYEKFLRDILGMEPIMRHFYVTDYVRKVWEKMGVGSGVKYYSNGLVVYEKTH